jgi:osomolarity two-component system, response regulator SSK1
MQPPCSFLPSLTLFIVWPMSNTFSQPVNFVWLERKVMEWGCMQALIDFDGWRKWKDFSRAKDESEAASKKAAAAKAKVKKNRNSLTASSQA